VASKSRLVIYEALLWLEHQMQNLAIVLDSCQSRCQSTSQHQTALWQSRWIWHLT
jgi:hypothetical protein